VDALPRRPQPQIVRPPDRPEQSASASSPALVPAPRAEHPTPKPARTANQPGTTVHATGTVRIGATDRGHRVHIVRQTDPSTGCRAYSHIRPHWTYKMTLILWKPPGQSLDHGCAARDSNPNPRIVRPLRPTAVNPSDCYQYLSPQAWP
jgi:hypothetical protein